MNNKTYVSPEEYAGKYDVSLKTVYNKIKRGELKTKRFFKKTLIEL